MTDEVRARELLECPRCGGPAQFRKALWPSDGNTDAVLHRVGEGCPLDHYSIGSTDEGVIADWNALAALRERRPAAVDREAELREVVQLVVDWDGDLPGGLRDAALEALLPTSGPTPDAAKESVHQRQAREVMNPGSGGLVSQGGGQSYNATPAAVAGDDLADEAEFEVWQESIGGDGALPVANASGPREQALREINHYAMMYGQDGPVEVFEVIRKPVAAARLRGTGLEG